MNASKIKILENGKKEDINFSAKNGELTFFYKDNLIFKHSKESPFVFAIKEKDTISKEEPLKEFELKKVENENYLLSFTNGVIVCNFHFYKRTDRLIIEVNNDINVKKLKFNFKKSLNSKIYGFEFCSEENFNKKTIQGGGLSPLILHYYIKGAYLTEVIGANKWSVDIKTFITLTAEAQKLSFEIYTGKNIDEIGTKYSYISQRINGIINKNSVILEEDCDNVINAIIKENKKGITVAGVIVDNPLSDLEKLRKLNFILKDSGIFTIARISPRVDIKQREILYFDKFDYYYNNNDELILDEKKYVYLDLKNEDTYKKVKNIFRSCLDTNVAGFYSEEKYININKNINNISNQEYSFIWQNAIKEIKEEYYKDVYIFDTPTVLTSKIGFLSKKVKNKKEINKINIKSVHNFLQNGLFFEIDKLNANDINNLRKKYGAKITGFIMKK